MSTDQNRGSLNDKFAGFGAEPTEGLFDSIYHTSDSSAGSLSTKFEEFGAEPSAGLWDSIAGQLDGKRRRRAIIWWWSGGVAAVFLMVLGLNGAGIFDAEEQQYSERESRQYTDQPEEVSDDGNGQNEAGPMMNDSNNPELSDNMTFNPDNETNPNIRNEDSGSQEDELRENELTENEPLNELDNENNRLPDQNDLTDISLMENLPLMSTLKIPVNPIVPAVEFEQVRNKKSWWEVGLEYDYWVHIADPFSVKSEDFVSYTVPPPTTAEFDSEQLFNPIANNDVLGLEESALYNNQPAAYGRVTKPLNLNFVLRYNFNKRFSLHSGLNYSRHFYRTTYSSGEIQYTASAVNSVGLPLGLKWNFLHRPNFDLYTDAQQLFEIPLSERREEVYQWYAAEKNDLQRNFTTGLMLSAQTGLGMRFGLTEKMSLNTAVNLRYYYFQRANGTAPLHKENMWLGGKLGLSWRL